MVHFNLGKTLSLRLNKSYDWRGGIPGVRFFEKHKIWVLIPKADLTFFN